jgi:dTDP-4-amino-4,6-dideoxygalactose transaminase
MNEVQAAMGLLQLKYVDTIIEKRKLITNHYRQQLANIPGIDFINDKQDVKYCYPYFPIFLDKEHYGISRDLLYEKLKKHNIFGRRYFYPLISQFPTYRGLESALPGKLPIAEKITERVICLPLYSELPMGTVDTICELIQSSA